MLEAVQLDCLASLRASLVEPLRAGDAAWLRLSGLGLDDPMAHGALCSTLERLGVTPGEKALRPQLVVLDWSVVSDCSAEGLAFFAVLARRFVGAGLYVIATEPQRSELKEILALSGLREACAGLHWVPCDAGGQRTIQSSARAALFSTASNQSLDDFCDDVSATLDRLAVPRMARRVIMGTTHEVLHNVLSHAGANHGAATALFFPRRRPKIFQIGIADDGLGIAGTVLRDPRHEWLAWLSDARVTGAVIRDNLSGRGAASGENGGGGGLARVVKRLLSGTASRVFLRSGAALIVLRSEDPEHFQFHRLTYGIGTQIQLELRLV